MNLRLFRLNPPGSLNAVRFRQCVRISWTFCSKSVCLKFERSNTLRGMATFTQILYHIVFSTKDRRRVFDAERRPELFRYTWGILENKKCHLYRINGVADHIHILTSLHPTLALSDLVHDLKLATSDWIKDKQIFPNFDFWQEGYGAFTVSWNDRDSVIEYIKSQPEHHKQVSFRDEYVVLLQKFGVEYEERYLI